MKKTYTLFVALIITGSLMAQTPQNFKYQAVARDAVGDVVADQAVGMQISILQGSASGTAVYVETFTPTTNEFGLINLNIGAGTVVSGDLTTIDWSADTYFIKIEMDITGGTTYEEYGTSQLLSVPYALHAKTAANIFSGNYNDLIGSPINVSTFTNDAGYLTSLTETDPVFGVHAANGITSTNITNWTTAYGWGNHSTAGYLTSFTEADPIFSAWDKTTGISITESQITDLNHFTTTDETDPVFGAWDKSIGISITESQITDFGNYESAFTKNTAFNKNFGNIAETITEGNDSRLSDARTPTSHAASHTDGSDDIQDATSSQKGLMTATYATKLEGIEVGAEVNVNADWNASSGDAQILNKPTDLTDLSLHNVTELADISNAGSGLIISSIERTKLLGIETSADVTDATNVNAAGAVMESDFNAGTFLYATSDNTPQPRTVSETRAILGLGSHYVGELFGGGIVFYVYDNGHHGLIASLDDLGGIGVQWGLMGTDVPGCESAWNGAANTAAIITAGGAAGEAAGLCVNYSGGGFTDWYLPANWELNNLNNSAFVISKILESDGDGSTNGLQFYGDIYYWSSTDDGTNIAWIYDFGHGYSNTRDKNNTYIVRAVRAF